MSEANADAQFFILLLAKVFHKYDIEELYLTPDDDDIFEGKEIAFSLDFLNDDVTHVTLKLVEDTGTSGDLEVTYADHDGNKLYTEKTDRNGHSVVELAPAGVMQLAANSDVDEWDDDDWDDE